MKTVKRILCIMLALFTVTGVALAAEDTLAPVAENMEMETYKGVSLGGRLTAHDDNGEQLTFELATEPMKGTVEISPDGHFVYTPAEKKCGRDYFGFYATDEAGNVSQEGTVIIRIRKRAACTFADMEGSGAEYAATVMAETGIFGGRTVGETMLFCPDETVARGEFLSMCMAVTEEEVLRGVSSTGFADDEALPDWLRPCVATALMNGYVTGTATEDGAVFDPEEALTVGEASLMLDSILGVTEVVSVSAMGTETTTDETAQACINLAACGIAPLYETNTEEFLTRADAAVLLEKAMELLGNR